MSEINWKGWSLNKNDAWISLIMHSIQCGIIVSLFIGYIYVSKCIKKPPMSVDKQTKQMKPKKTRQNADNIVYISLLFSIVYIITSYYFANLSILTTNMRYNCFVRSLRMFYIGYIYIVLFLY